MEKGGYGLILKFKYLLNRDLKLHSEKVFNGISNGRKKALENWFKDKWAEINNIKNNVLSLENKDDINYYLKEKVKSYEDFCEIFIADEHGEVICSSFDKHIGINISKLPNFNAAKGGRRLMYGPYIDELTLDLDLRDKKFYDEVTLMFSDILKDSEDNIKILCCRALNDDMSNVIQDEDTHIYKDSGDNYLFMVKSNRNIKPGTAISRSRFEDDTFTFGENLKAGVHTKKWGIVKVNKHTEFEIVFNDPETNELHQGVKNTIKNGESIDCWPGYPDYRHIMVGGKGTIIKPPYCDEVWGMMCEGDIAEIYNFKSINLKIPIAISILTAILLILNRIVLYNIPSLESLMEFATWFIVSIFSYYICKRITVSPLGGTIRILQNIAEGEGDLTKRVKKISNDEVGELSRWFNKFINNQMIMTRRVKKAVKTTRKSINIVSNMTDYIKNGMDVIEKTVKVLLKNSKHQNRVFQKTRDRFSEITASIEEMNSLVLEITGIIKETDENSYKSQNKSSCVLNNMNELEVTIKQCVKSINELQKYSVQITEVINIINNISKQTQLLALNASIEAARAGNEGKGFSIVASEISKLALETENATKSITDVINKVNVHTEETYKYAGEINEKISVSAQSVEESINSFRTINEDIRIIADSMKSISKITINQNDNVSEIMMDISSMADKVEEFTEVSATRSEESLELVDKILYKIKKLQQATAALEYSSENLDEMIGDFKLK